MPNDLLVSLSAHAGTYREHNRPSAQLGCPGGRATNFDWDCNVMALSIHLTDSEGVCQVAGGTRSCASWRALGLVLPRLINGVGCALAPSQCGGHAASTSAASYHIHIPPNCLLRQVLQLTALPTLCAAGLDSRGRAERG